MFSKDQTAGRVVCLADYGRVNKGAIVPVSNELYADVEVWLAEGNALAPFDGYPVIPQVIEVPVRVSRFQARAALMDAGLLEQVETLMQAPETTARTRLAWQDAQEFRRDSPTVAGMAVSLGLTDAELDELFIAAIQIEA